jgi:hypothetical protein
MIFKFRLLSDEVDNFVREIAISSEATFLDLQNAILDSVSFSKDQLTSFFMCNDEWEKGAEVTLIEMDSSPEVDSWVMESTKLSDLIEEEDQKLIFVFDLLNERSYFIDCYQFIPSKELPKAVCTLSEGEPPVQLLEFDESSLQSTSNIQLDDAFYGDQEFDMDELDTDGFTGLDDLADSDKFSTEF